MLERQHIPANEPVRNIPHKGSSGFEELSRDEFVLLEESDRVKYLAEGLTHEDFNHPTDGPLYDGKPTRVEGAGGNLVDARWGWLELVPGQGHWRPMDVEYKPAAPLPQLPPSRRPRHQRVRRPKSGSQAGLFGDSI